jgi:hypothetical protein
MGPHSVHHMLLETPEPDGNLSGVTAKRLLRSSARSAAARASWFAP